MSKRWPCPQCGYATLSLDVDCPRCGRAAQQEGSVTPLSAAAAQPPSITPPRPVDAAAVVPAVPPVVPPAGARYAQPQSAWEVILIILRIMLVLATGLFRCLGAIVKGIFWLLLVAVLLLLGFFLFFRLLGV